MTPRRRIGLDIALYAGSAAFAAITATSTLLPHRAWGSVAWIGYAAAALVSALLLVPRQGLDRLRLWLTAGTFGAVCLTPLVMQAVQRAGGRGDRAQEEVLVIEHGGQRLIHDGTPYLGRAAIKALPEAERLLGYLPYQPGMAVFGLPSAAGDGWWTDARIWFALVTVAALGVAVGLVPAGAARVRALQGATVLPICALTLATGGDDLPVLALGLLAFALAATDRWAAAGIAVGVAGALKLFAWPVAVVLLVTVIAQRKGWPRYATGAIGIPVMVMVAPLLVNADAVVENIFRYPTGRGVVTSPAQSPLLGQLIAAHVPGGRVIALALLGLVGIGIAVWLVRRPPATVDRAALVCALGLLAAIVLMPTTRFGYLLYPAAIALWIPALRTAAPAPPTPTP